MVNTSQKENSRPRTTQRTLLVLILLGILGVCIVLAWWMTKRIDAPTAQGIEIVRDIQARKLLSFWGENKTHRQHYFIYQRAGQKQEVIGWKFEYRSQNKNLQEGFIGGEIERIPNISYAYSQWKLTNELDKGTYESHITRRKPNGEVDDIGASIELDDGTLRLQQDFPGEKRNSESKIPDNYIPEGAMSLVFREVAIRKTHAKFRMIFDSVPPVGSRPRFGVLEVRYLNAPEDNPSGAVLEVKQIILSQTSTLRVILDSAGNIVSETAGNRVTAPVSEKDFSDFFPYDARRLSRISFEEPLPPEPAPKPDADKPPK